MELNKIGNLTSLLDLAANIYRVYQNDWGGFDVDYINKYGEQN